MSESDGDIRVDPKVVNTALLFKMSKRLESIEKVLLSQVPLGKLLSIPGGVAVTGDTYIYLVKGLIIYPNNSNKSIPTYRRPYFSISIENEGVNDCTVTVNPEETWGKRTLNSGETLELDMKKAAIRELEFNVNTGESCTVQISGVV